MLAAKKPFTPQVLDELRTHVSQESQRDCRMDTLSKDVSAALDTAIGTLETAGRDTVAYGKALTAASGELGGHQSPADCASWWTGLIAATHAMEARTKDLEDELQRSSQK